MVHNIIAIPMELSQEIQIRNLPKKERKLKKIFFPPSVFYHYCCTISCRCSFSTAGNFAARLHTA